MGELRINFRKGNGLVPVIIQDYRSGDVLMLGFMDKDAFEATLREGRVIFWSRTRRKSWMKGEESGNGLQVKKIYTDCDRDALLIKAKLAGKNACHKGFKSCFYEKIL